MNTDIKITKLIGGPAIATAGLLLIPLLAKLITEEMAWTLSDFIAMGALIFGTGLTYQLVTHVLAPRVGENLMYRVAVGLTLFAGLFLIWSNLAVGIIGSEDNPINALYFGVIFVGIIGTFLARFKPTGMSITLFAMAMVQAIIAVIAISKGMAELPGTSVYEILALNGFFITLFVVAALLFRYVRKPDSPGSLGSER